MSTTDTGGVGEFRVGQVLGQSFSLFGANFVNLTILAFIPYVINQLVAVGLNLMAVGVGDFANFLISIVVQVFMVAAVGELARQRMAGQTLTLSQLVASGLAGMNGTAIVVGVLATIAVLIGMLLLIAPGVFLMVALWIIMPIAVLERAGIGDSFSRSFELTKGNRWRVLGLAAVFFLILVFGVGPIAVFLEPMTLSADIGDQLVAAAIMALFGAIFGAWSTCMTVASYIGLRSAKEGLPPSAIAGVFD